MSPTNVINVRKSWVIRRTLVDTYELFTKDIFNKCDECVKGFWSEGDLFQHLRVVHEELVKWGGPVGASRIIHEGFFTKFNPSLDQQDVCITVGYKGYLSILCYVIWTLVPVVIDLCGLAIVNIKSTNVISVRRTWVIRRTLVDTYDLFMKDIFNKCDECVKSFWSEEDLFRHLRVVHEELVKWGGLVGATRIVHEGFFTKVDQV